MANAYGKCQFAVDTWMNENRNKATVAPLGDLGVRGTAGDEQRGSMEVLQVDAWT